MFETQPHSSAHVLATAVFVLQWYVRLLQLRPQGPQVKCVLSSPSAKKCATPLLCRQGEQGAGDFAGCGDHGLCKGHRWMQSVLHKGRFQRTQWKESAGKMWAWGESKSGRDERSEVRSLRESETGWGKTSWGLLGVKVQNIHAR